MPANRNVTDVETYSGQYVDLVNPDPATIKIEDIAVHLSRIARFGGGTSRPYSVAEHSVRVSWAVSPGYAMPGLLHDAHEAYIGDLIAPFKKVLRDAAPGLVEGIAQGLDQAIGKALGVDPGLFKLLSVKDEDDEMMYAEAATLKWSHGVGEHWANDTARMPIAAAGWGPSRAERMFIARYDELTRA